MKKVIAFAVKAVAFARSPQGKRDIALVVAAASAVADFVKSVS